MAVPGEIGQCLLVHTGPEHIGAEVTFFSCRALKWPLWIRTGEWRQVLVFLTVPREPEGI